MAILLLLGRFKSFAFFLVLFSFFSSTICKKSELVFEINESLFCSFIGIKGEFCEEQVTIFDCCFDFEIFSCCWWRIFLLEWFSFFVKVIFRFRVEFRVENLFVIEDWWKSLTLVIDLCKIEKRRNKKKMFVQNKERKIKNWTKENKWDSIF